MAKKQITTGGQGERYLRLRLSRAIIKNSTNGDTPTTEQVQAANNFSQRLHSEPIPQSPISSHP